MLVHPARVPEVPRLQVGVLKAPLGELFDRPVRRGLMIRRPGEARSVAVGKHVQRVHHLRMLRGFLAYAGVDVLVHRILRKQQAGGREQCEWRFHIPKG